MKKLELSLVESEAKILLEALIEKEAAMAKVCESSKDEDEIADVGNDLIELLGNLLDNARKFAISQIQISFVDKTIIIEDDGPGVAEVEISSIRQRGRRLDEIGQGFGLGLAIVDDIADIYELELTYGRSPLGGLRVKMALNHTNV